MFSSSGLRRNNGPVGITVPSLRHFRWGVDAKEAATHGARSLNWGQNDPAPMYQTSSIKREFFAFVPNGVRSFVVNVCSRCPLFGSGRTGSSAIIWMVAWRIVFRHAQPKRSFSVSCNPDASLGSSWHEPSKVYDEGMSAIGQSKHELVHRT